MVLTMVFKMKRKSKKCVVCLMVAALMISSLFTVLVDARPQMERFEEFNGHEISCPEGTDDAYFEVDTERSAYPFPNHYPSVQELYDWYDDLVLEFPDMVTKHHIGNSYEGRDLWVLEITSDEDVQVDEKPEVLIDACMHAREWSTPQVASYLMWRLLNEYDTNDTIYWLLNNRIIHIMPMQNPDGYIFDGNGNYAARQGWRKNRNASTPTSSVGVDLNRNWDIMWSGGNYIPGADDYRGVAPFSEYENWHLRDYMLSRDIQSYQNLHSYHGSLLIPLMYSTSPSPHDSWYRGMASHMTSLTSRLGNENWHYAYGQPHEMIGYTSTGGVVSWVYDNIGATGLCFEVHTGGSGMEGFYPNPSLIMTINNDLDNSLIYQCRVADTDLGDGTTNLYPPVPYILYGTVNDIGGSPVIEMDVTLENLDTGETLSIPTNSNGYYELNYGNLVENGYTLTDTFSVSVWTSYNEFTIGDEWGQRIDIEVIMEGDPPEITLTSPNGGEVWYAHTDEDISWTTIQGEDPIDRVDLWYSIDAGTSWNSIAAGIDDTGSYYWTVPNVNSDQSLVRARVVDTLGRWGANISDDVFTIIGVPPAPPQNLDVERIGTTETWTWLYNQPHRTTPPSATGLNGPGTYWGAMRVELHAVEAIGIGCYIMDNPTYIQGYIYTDGAGGTTPGTMLGQTENIASPGPGEWLEIPYTDPVPLARGHYWIVLEVRVPVQGNRGLGRYDGHLNDNAWLSLDGSSWSELQDYGLIFNHALEVLTLEAGDGDDHNQISWDASPNDPVEVSHYNIHRSEFQSGPWDGSTFVDSVIADGSGAYEYLDFFMGMADGIFWWYVVRAVGTNGMEGQNTDAVQEPGAPTETFDIPLYADGAAGGWNFVSFNLVPGDTSPEAILENPTYGISGNYDRLMYYNAADGEWLSYVPGRAARYNNMHSWNHHMGLWIRMTTSDTLTIAGTLPASTEITLYPGWTMVGLPSPSAGNHGLPGAINRVGYFDATAEYNLAYSYSPGAFVFEPGRGYWLYNPTDSAVVWTVGY